MSSLTPQWVLYLGRPLRHNLILENDNLVASMHKVSPL